MTGYTGRLTPAAANDAILREIVAEAVRLYDDKANSNGLFNTAAFQAAVRRRFDTEGIPARDWCDRVLRGLCYVAPMNSGCHWRDTRTKERP